MVGSCSLLFGKIRGYGLKPVQTQKAQTLPCYSILLRKSLPPPCAHIPLLAPPPPCFLWLSHSPTHLSSFFSKSCCQHFLHTDVKSVLEPAWKWLPVVYVYLQRKKIKLFFKAKCCAEGRTPDSAQEGKEKERPSQEGLLPADSPAIHNSKGHDSSVKTSRSKRI